MQKRDIQFDQKEKGETNFWLTKLAPNYDYDPETPDKIDGNIFNFNPYIGIPNETKINCLYPLIRYPKIDSDYIYIAYQMFIKSDIEETTTWRWLKLRRPHHFVANVYIPYRILSPFLPYIYCKNKESYISFATSVEAASLKQSKFFNKFKLRTCHLTHGLANSSFRDRHTINCYNRRTYCDFL